MICKTNSLEIPHTERRSRGLSAEIDRLIWERILGKIPAPSRRPDVRGRSRPR